MAGIENAGPSNIAESSNGTYMENFLAETPISILASEASKWIMGKFEDPQWEDKIRKVLGCTRLAGCVTLDCDNCHEEISGGQYSRELYLRIYSGLR